MSAVSQPQPLDAIAPPTVSIDPALGAVGLIVQLPASVDRLSISRTGPSGAYVYVRGFWTAVVTPNSRVNVRDFEPPLGVPLLYTIYAWVAAIPDLNARTTVTVTVPAKPSDDPFLVDLIQPQNTQRVVVEQLAELDHNIPAGVHWILGRHTPIVTVDLAHTPTFTLQFVTKDALAWERARDALGNGAPLLLRTPPEQGVGNMYLFATGWKEQRPSRLAFHGDRRFVVEAVQVDRPDPDLWPPSAPTTWATVIASYASWADLKATRSSWDLVQWDYTHARPTSVVPWPPSDV